MCYIGLYCIIFICAWHHSFKHVGMNEWMDGGMNKRMVVWMYVSVCLPACLPASRVCTYEAMYVESTCLTAAVLKTAAMRR